MSHHYLRFEDVVYDYPGGHRALNGISFHITHGEKVALLGRNGAGKSTVLQLCNGLLLPLSGSVNVGGVPITVKTLPLIRQSVGFVFQNPDDQLFMPTVEDDVAFGPLNMKLPIEDVERRVGEALGMVDALDLRHRVPSQLSGGQKRIVALATVLSMGPSVMILDEPTTNLDWLARRRVIDVLKRFSHTTLVATHDFGLVKEICGRCIVIDNGRVVADMSTERLLTDRVMLKNLGIPEEAVGMNHG